MKIPLLDNSCYFFSFPWSTLSKVKKTKEVNLILFIVREVGPGMSLATYIREVALLTGTKASLCLDYGFGASSGEYVNYIR